MSPVNNTRGKGFFNYILLNNLLKFLMKNHAIMCNYIITLLSFSWWHFQMILIESLDLTNKVYFLEDVVGVKKFLINWIPCTIPKVAPTQLKVFRRYIYLLRLWSKVIEINCSLSLMRRSTQDLITRPYNPNRQPLHIQPLACHANPFYYVQSM